MFPYNLHDTNEETLVLTSNSHLSDDSFYDFNAHCESVAASRNCIVVYPKDNELQIDIDSSAAYERYLAAVKYLPFITGIEDHASASGLPHRHITITTNRTFTDIERIAFQYMLGSDYIRESLNLMRVLNNVKNPTRLFEPVQSLKKTHKNPFKRRNS